MGNKIRLIALIALLYFDVMTMARPQDSISSSDCGPNATFLTCGLPCQPKCSDNPLLGVLCAAQCVVGCQCDFGYVKNDAGSLVNL
ncbi:unnamed protein product [Ceratitis capitata]|uniref:(Mediterranean fruit fly) hypothetical protein n=1 Tax=Ceratitis capitata TaxID=7213 RepID=A0A811VH37_CERCA|nr:unnamed protein product [Ceratitis capitata]